MRDKPERIKWGFSGGTQPLACSLLGDRIERLSPPEHISCLPFTAWPASPASKVVMDCPSLRPRHQIAKINGFYTSPCKRCLVGA